MRQREAREKGNNYATLRGNFQWQMKKRWKLFCERPNHEISSVSCYFLQWAASKLFLLFKLVNSANVCPFVTLDVLAMFGVNLQYSYTSLSATRNILARKWKTDVPKRNQTHNSLDCEIQRPRRNNNRITFTKQEGGHRSGHKPAIFALVWILDLVFFFWLQGWFS